MHRLYRSFALGLIVLVTLALPSVAFGGADIRVTVTNKTPVPLKLVETDNRCWYSGDFNQANAPMIGPGDTKQLNSEVKASGSCAFVSSSMDWDVLFERPGGSFKTALGDADARDYAPGGGTWGMSWPYATYSLSPRATPRGWFPIAPQQGGTGGPGGMFCVDASRTSNTSLQVDVKGGNECAGKAAAGASRTRSTADLGPAPAGPAARGGNDPQVIYDVLSLGQGACTLLHPDQAWPASPCNSISDASQWDLHNVTTDVKSVQAQGSPQVISSWNQIRKFEQTNNTGEKGQLNYTIGYTLGQTKSTASQFGFKIGQKISIKKTVNFKILSGDVTGEFSSEQNWSTTDTTSTTDTRNESTASSITTQTGGTTYLYAFQSTGDLGFNYNADLTAGAADTAQPIRTPMTRPLAMSAARNQPCIGYLAGTGDPGSLVGLGRLAASRGISTETLRLKPDELAFLQAVPGFAAQSDRCPGFPAGYPAQMAFKGTATITGQAAGPANVSWDPRLGSIKTCAFFKPDAGSPARAAGTGDPDPCAQGPSAPAPNGTGTVVDGADHGPGETMRGDAGANLLLANGKRDLGTARYLGEGGGDVFQGRRFADRFFGGSGADIMMGAQGDDVLRGDAGSDTLAGGGGRDDLADRHGDNALLGGAGDDRLRSGAGARGGMLGQAGDDVLAMRGHARVAMRGGPGDDTYRLTDGAPADDITELAKGGSDRVLTDHSLRVPVNVERARAVGTSPVTLRAGIGDTTLVGGPADDTLAGGPGSDRLDGRGGDDEIRLAAFGFDRVSGGKGADRFIVLNKRPPDPSFPIGLKASDASAHVIDDFSARQGDRLVLSTAHFGGRLADLRGGDMRITEGAHAQGHGPQLVFDRKTHLLRFDPNGKGGTPATVIAILDGLHSVPQNAISIVGSNGHSG